MNNNSQTFTFKRLSVVNIGDLEQLYQAVHGRKIKEGYYLKKYDTAYTGAIFIGYIAYANDRIPVAYYGVIPTFINYNGSKIIAAQAVDAMTVQQYRNQGLFTTLVQNTFELCRNEGIRLIFGFPNQNSFPALVQKSGWQHIETMDRFAIPVRKCIPLEKIAGKYAFFKPIYEQYKSGVLKRYINQSNIPNSVQNHNGVARDVNYFNYKKTYSPSQIIRITNATVWVKIQDGLHIGDMNCAVDDFDMVIKKLISLSRKMGLKQIHFHTSPGTALHALFAARYPVHASFQVIFKKLDEALNIDTIKFTYGDIDIF